MIGRIFSWLFLIALVGGGVAAFYWRASQEKKVAVSRRVPRVKVARPVVRGLLVRLSYPASLEAIQAAEIRPVEAKGFVRKLTVDKGDKVKKGQLLVQIDCPEIHDKRRQATQAIRAAKAMFANAQVTLSRLEAMRRKQFVSQLETDNAQAVQDTTQARLKNDEARLAEVDNMLAYCTIRAPFSGEVAMRFADVGEQVRPGGRPLLLIVRRDAMRVQVSIPERDAAQIREGLPAELTVQGLPGESFFGKVTRFNRTVDAATRTMLVEIEIPNPSGVLKPNMFGRVQLTVTRFPRAMIVPATAVLATEAGTYIFVVRDGKATRLQVKVGHDSGDEVQILGGLSARDQVILVGRDAITEGAAVETGEDEPASAAAQPAGAATDEAAVADGGEKQRAPGEDTPKKPSPEPAKAPKAKPAAKGPAEAPGLEEKRLEKKQLEKK